MNNLLVSIIYDLKMASAGLDIDSASEIKPQRSFIISTVNDCHGERTDDVFLDSDDGNIYTVIEN